MVAWAGAPPASIIAAATATMASAATAITESYSGFVLMLLFTPHLVHIFVWVSDTGGK